MKGNCAIKNRKNTNMNHDINITMHNLKESSWQKK